MKFIECFRTWQGEGPDRGKSVLLVRFKYCNRNCPWCDTMVKMRVSEEADYSIKNLQEIITENKCGLMITGGEPTVPSHFDDTVKLLIKLKYPYANIESNGCNLKQLIETVDSGKCTFIKYIYSPKIFTEEDYYFEVNNTRKLIKYDNVFIKLVVDNQEYSKKYIEWLARETTVNNRVYLMPEGKDTKNLMKNAPIVFDLCEQFKFNFSSRDHIIFGFI